MESNIGPLVSLSLCLLLTFLHTLFAIAETALLRSHTAVLRRPELSTRVGNRFALQLVQNPSYPLLFLQLAGAASLVAFSVILAGHWSEVLAQELFGAEFRTGLAEILVLVLGVLLHVLVALGVGRAVGIQAPEKTLMLVAPLLQGISFCLRPVLVLLVTFCNLLLKPFGISMPESLEFCHSAADLSRYLEGSNGDEGEIDEDEKEMLQGVFEFSRTVAREVMTPRTDIVTIPLDATLSEIVKIASESGQSRFPVRGAVIDDIRGIVLARDLLPITLSEAKKNDFSLSRVMRKAYFIPDTKPIDDLLNEFKRRKLHMAIVLDEHGGVDGLVTLEDLIEEIVGEIFDESDTPEEDFEVDANGDILVDGGMLVFELNEHFDLHIPEGDYDTIAGFIFTSLGRMPHIGDTIEIEENGVLVVTPGAAAVPMNTEMDSDDESLGSRLVIVVEAIESNRIALVRIKPVELSESAESLKSRAAS